MSRITAGRELIKAIVLAGGCLSCVIGCSSAHINKTVPMQQLPEPNAAEPAKIIQESKSSVLPNKSGKKGFGDTGFNHAGGQLGASWYYNWQPVSGSKNVPEFIPMIWSGHFVTNEIIGALRKSGASALLGFNEPDLDSQSNMTVDEAIRLWPRLQETGLRLGSPSPAQGYCDDGCWLDEFMEEAKKRGYRVDFIALHWYWDIRGKEAVPNLKKFLEKAHERFNRPIWLTEFGALEQEGTEKLTEAEVSAFVREALPMLESLPFLERYAWFASYTKKWKLYPQSSLVDDSGNLTGVGRAYAGE